VGEGGERVGLQPKRESLKKMGVVVQNDQVVFVTREAEDMWSLEIIVDKIKGLNNPGCGSGKRKTRVTVELTSMTEALRGASSIGDVWATGKLNITSGLGCPRRRCQTAEVVVIARTCVEAMLVGEAKVVVVARACDEATLVGEVEGKWRGHRGLYQSKFPLFFIQDI
jgi:hypothetical protein